MKRVSIGDFSRMTHLSVKTLRHYHEIGLLAPDAIDSTSSYRYYALSQVETAHVIRRFRDLGMTLAQIRVVLGAPTRETRNELISRHADALEAKLEATRAAISSLRALVRETAPIPIVRRRVEAMEVLAITERVARGDLGRWWHAAFTDLRRALAEIGIEARGPAGALFETDLFARDYGEITAFVPVGTGVGARGRARPLTLDASDLAIAVHHGAHDDIDRTYGALGTYVTEHAIGTDGPLREHYQVDRFTSNDATTWRTEVCWAIAPNSVLPREDNEKVTRAQQPR